MKKLSRIAAFLAAGVLLFGAVGCSDDDDGGDVGGGVDVTASVAPAIELEEGKSDTYVVTFSVTGDTFSDDAKSLGVDAPIPDGYLELTASDSKVTISEMKVSERFNDTEGKVSIKVTAADGAKSGTITAKLLKGALTDTTDTVTATSISYTIKGDEGQQGGGDETTYTLDITAIPETIGATTKVDDTVTVVSTIKNSSGKDQTIKYSTNGYVQMSGAKAQAGYGLQLTLPKAAVITATATEKSATASDTKLVLLSKDGSTTVATTNDVLDKNGTASTSLKALTLEAEAGTYLFGASANGCFVYSLKIEYK